MFSSSDINKIKNIDSKNNFELVLQSYYSKNFKSCILLLYNLVVNDLYSKLVLMDENNYVNCRSELETIENILKEGNESKYSIVEEKIFETYSIKKILNHSTNDLLSYFKKVRNKCAHPFFFKEYDYNPSEEEVYLFIKKIYNEILIVDAFFKDPYEVMKKDINMFQFPDIESMVMGISSIENDNEKVKKYFTKKYFQYMTDSNFVKLFKSLIELSITKNTDEINKDKYKHFLLLKSMLDYMSYNGKISLLNNQYDWQKINENDIYDDYGKKLEEQENFSLSFIFNILKYNHSFIEEIKDENEGLYDYLYQKLYKTSYLFAEFWMIFDSDINNAAKKIPDNLTSYNYYQIIQSIYQLVDRNITIELLKKMVSKVPTFDGYDRADRCIELFIKILKEADPKIEQELINEHFSLMNENRQIYDKSRNSRDYQLKQITDLGYDLSDFENLEINKGDTNV